MGSTASKVQNMSGNKLYQRRARQALPILVRQAASESPIFYQDIATELGMPNPRNMNWVLGSVGVSLDELSNARSWNEPIPHIQSLAINQHQRLPGSGFDGFLAERTTGYSKLSNAEKRDFLREYWQRIYTYRYWPDVLEALKLRPASPDDATELLDEARTGRGGGGGEGPEHKALKEYVRTHPASVGLPVGFQIGKPEAPLSSGDRMDILFRSSRRKVGIEVKSLKSNDADLARGLFQCVKYQAIMEAERGFEAGAYSIETMLVIGRAFPARLVALKNSLGVQVVEIIGKGMAR